MTRPQNVIVVPAEVPQLPPEPCQPPPYWRCPVCEQLKPLHPDHFPLKKDGLPGKMCLMCEIEAPERKKRVENTVRAKKLVRQLVATSRNTATRCVHPAEISLELFEQMGGLEAFCKLWRDQFFEAMQNDPGSRTVLNQFNEMAKLAGIATGLQQHAPDVASMSEEQLAHEVVRLMGRASEEAQLALLSADPADEQGEEE